MQPTLTLHNSVLTSFPEEGEISVSVQASNGRSMVQDTRRVRVYGKRPSHASAVFTLKKDFGPNVCFPTLAETFHVIPLSFSKHLDRFNPNIPEWREDVGQVVTKILAKVKDT